MIFGKLNLYFIMTKKGLFLQHHIFFFFQLLCWNCIQWHTDVTFLEACSLKVNLNAPANFLPRLLLFHFLLFFKGYSRVQDPITSTSMCACQQTYIWLVWPTQLTSILNQTALLARGQISRVWLTPSHISTKTLDGSCNISTTLIYTSCEDLF